MLQFFRSLGYSKIANVILASLIVVGGITTGEAEAEAAGFFSQLFAYFSAKQVPALDGRGNVIYDTVVALDENGNVVRDSNGNPVYNKIAKTVWRGDPVGPEIIKLGLHLTFDPSKIKVVTDLSSASYPLNSAFGFYCGFSTNGSCPEGDDPFIPDEFGDPLPGSTWNLNVDNLVGELTFSYDFSTTPVTITKDTNFFGFLFEPVVVGVVDGIYTLPPGSVSFVQHPESSQQFCVTTSTEETGLQCSTIPEPSSTLSFLAFGILGAGATLKRKLKPSKSKEKELTKVC
jgi:hypothetical protein